MRLRNVRGVAVRVPRVRRDDHRVGAIRGGQVVIPLRAETSFWPGTVFGSREPLAQVFKRPLSDNIWCCKFTTQGSKSYGRTEQDEKRLPCPANGTEERVLTLREHEAREWDRRVVVCCGRLRHGIPHGGAEGTEERVLTLREVKLANGIDESASVVVGHGKISLMRKVERVTEMRDPCHGARTGGVRECRDHLYPSCDRVILRGLST